MKTSVPQWRPHIVLASLLAVIVGACSGGGGGGSSTIDPDGVGNATLSWTPPTEYEDGSVLTDLAGYKIYYGNEPGNYGTSIEIDNPGIAIYVVDYLAPNTYYFVLTSINGSGVESAYSNEVRKVVL